MRYFLILLSLGLPFSNVFAEYKSNSPTSKTTSPYLHIMDEKEQRDLKMEHDLNSFQGKEEKLQQRQERRQEEKEKQKKKGAR